MGRPNSPRAPSPAHSTSSDGSNPAAADAASATAPAVGGASGSSGQPSTRNFKASQTAAYAAVVESTSAHRNLIPGLAELVGGSSMGIIMNTEVVAPTTILASSGDGDNTGNALDSETATSVGHPSLPSVDSVSTAASRLINECPPFVTMSVRDSAPQLKLEDSPIVETESADEVMSTNPPSDNDKTISANFRRRLVVKGGMKGYRMSRATHGVTSGCYYFETVILRPESGDNSASERGVKRSLQEAAEETSKENITDSSAGSLQKKKKSMNDSMNGHLRIGWSTRLADLQAPVGYNEHSYGIRDINGSRIHKSQREDKWGGVGFSLGDVVGMAICLVDKPTTSNTTSSISLANANVGTEKNAENKKENTHNSESKDLEKPSTLTNHIRFFKNGEPMGKDGIAFDNVNPGTYHPSVSCYMDGAAQLNFGPHFIYPPQGLPTEINPHPISELCTSPPLPEEAVEKVTSSGGGSRDGKKIFFSKRTDDGIVLAFKELVKMEATTRHEAYLKHLDLHRREILALRKERGLPITDVAESVQQHHE
ncbi:hypothetical protein ACHAXR_007257 [Thalassiosira sp. AJA248-18]